jgi:hypothetical protein
MNRRLPILLLPLLLAVPLARADEAPSAPPAAPEEPRENLLAVIVGDGVNLRVGPRLDSRAVTQLSDGAVLIVVQKAGEWVGVLVPQGFPAAVSSQYLAEEGTDGVRVTADEVNFRVHPPEFGGTPGAPFRTRAQKGALLTLLSREGDWTWVLAPEEVQAFVHSRFVREVGPVSAHQELLAKARAERIRQVEMLSAARRAQAAEAAGLELRRTMGEVQDLLHRHRVERATDKAPIVLLADRLDREIESSALAPPRVLLLARALRDDLEGEIALTVARLDAELARLRGDPDAPAPTPAPKVDRVEVEGIVRWEPTPGWRDPGVHILWIDEAPRFVLRLAPGGVLPHPDLKALCDGRPHRVVAAQPGDRVFGLPALDIRSVE